jgi:hypothetical protein
MNLVGAAAHSLSALPAGELAMTGSGGIAAGDVLLRVGDVSLAGYKMAQAVATLGAVPVLTEVQARFRLVPEAPPETPAGEAVLPPL